MLELQLFLQLTFSIETIAFGFLMGLKKIIGKYPLAFLPLIHNFSLKFGLLLHFQVSMDKLLRKSKIFGKKDN